MYRILELSMLNLFNGSIWGTNTRKCRIGDVLEKLSVRLLIEQFVFREF